MSDKIAKIKARAQKDYYFLAKYILGFSKMSEKPHQELCDHVMRPGKKRKLTLMPRGSFKSSVVTVAGSVFKIINNPNIRILIASETQKNATKYVGEIKDQLEKNLKFTTLFGNWKGTHWRSYEFVVSKRTELKKECTVTASSLEKGLQTGMHYDCLHPDTKVYTSKGYKTISELTIHEKVFTKDGHFHRIKALTKKPSNKRMFGIRASYQAEPNWVTEDHRVLIFRYHCLQWIEARGLLISDRLVVPKNQGSTRIISRTNQQINKLLDVAKIWRLIGYWLGDGAATQNSKGCNGIRITIGCHKTDVLEDINSIVGSCLGVNTSCHKTKSSTIRIFFAHAEMKEILAKFGTHAWNKYLPPFALNALDHQKRNLILGYFKTDGHYRDPNHFSFVSTSLSLLSGFQMVLASMNIPSGITQSKKSGQQLIVGNLCNTRDSWTLWSTHNDLALILGFNPSLNTKPHRSYFTDQYWMVPISKIETKSYSGDVYDIQVDKEPSFYSPGMIMHNCIILDDVVSQANINTQEQLEKTQTFYKLLLSILDPGGELWVNGTRWSMHDLYGFLMDPKNGESGLFDVMVKKAIQEDGSLLMPKVLNEQFLAEQKATQGDWIFSCQYLNEAHSNLTAPFKKEWMQVYKENPKGLIYFITVDLAVSKTQEADYIAIIVNGVNHLSHWYIQEAMQLKITLPELIDNLFDLSRIFQPLMAVGFQKFSLEKALQDFLLPEMDKRKHWFPIKEVPTDTHSSKAARIKGLQPKFRNREVFLKEEHTDLYNQLIMYPQVDHDDLLDALKDQMVICFPSDYVPNEQEKSLSHLTSNEVRAWDPLKRLSKKRVRETKNYI